MMNEFQAEGMINHIGYPDFIKNDTDLDKHYERVSEYFRIPSSLSALYCRKEVIHSNNPL